MEAELTPEEQINVNKQRMSIASMHHRQSIGDVVEEFGTIGFCGVRLWNVECDRQLKKLGHPNTDFLNCTCCENKEITG